MIITDDIFLDFVYSFNGNGIQYNKIIKNASDDILNYLKNKYEDSNSLEETIYRIVYNKADKCPICGQKCKFDTVHKKYYTLCDNIDCFNIYRNNKTKDTCIFKYGVTHHTKLKEVQDKKRYTCEERYGVQCSLQNKEVIEKAKNTKRILYNDFNYNNRSKMKQTKKERYGNENYNNHEKSVATCNKRYGHDNVSEDNDIRKKKSETMSSDKSQQKRYESLKLNNSFNSSKEEELCFILLLNHFKTVYRHYKSDVYPFECDFYIPDLNLYIEYNGSRYHNKHPFNINDINDQYILEKLKKESERIHNKNGNKKCQADNVIYTWTDLDIRKRNIAKINNLNFLELWNIEDVKKFINNINYEKR